MSWLKTFRLREPLQVYQFEGTFESKEIVERLSEWYDLDWKWDRDNEHIIIKDFLLSFPFDLEKGDYLIIMSWDEVKLMKKEDFETLFTENKFRKRRRL